MRMRKPRRRSSVPCPPPTIGWRSRWRNGRVWPGPARAHKPRPITAMRYRLKTVISLRPSAPVWRKRQAASCCSPMCPPRGSSPSARDILTVYKDQHGTEQNYGFLKDPVLVTGLPEEAGTHRSLGPHLIVGAAPLALDGARYADVCGHHPHALARVDKRYGAADRLHDDHEVRGRDRLEVRHDRQLARPLSVVQQHYLTALDVPATCFTLPAG